MLQIYTGNGKGKTTAALGLAWRALGHGKRVLLIQFMKKGRDFGEIKAARRFHKLKILQTGKNKWLDRKLLDPQDRQSAQRGLACAQKALKDKSCDLIILDELNVAVEFGLLQCQEVKQVLKNRPKDVEVVITGRYAHPQLLEMADLVSEVRELKH